MFFLLFKVGENLSITSLKITSFDRHYMTLVEIKNFSALIDKKPFLINPQKTSKKRMKNLPKCQETMTIHRKTYYITYVTKTIINSLVYIYQGNINSSTN